MGKNSKVRHTIGCVTHTAYNRPLRVILLDSLVRHTTRFQQGPLPQLGAISATRFHLLVNHNTTYIRLNLNLNIISRITNRRRHIQNTDRIRCTRRRFITVHRRLLIDNMRLNSTSIPLNRANHALNSFQLGVNDKNRRFDRHQYKKRNRVRGTHTQTSNKRRILNTKHT